MLPLLYYIVAYGVSFAMLLTVEILDYAAGGTSLIPVDLRARAVPYHRLDVSRFLA